MDVRAGLVAGRSTQTARRDSTLGLGVAWENKRRVALCECLGKFIDSHSGVWLMVLDANNEAVIPITNVK